MVQPDTSTGASHQRRSDPNSLSITYNNVTLYVEHAYPQEDVR
jgi:hypothetical protein